MTTDWSHFYLTGWPFQTVPDENFAGIWADRSQLREDVERMIWRWPRVDKSTLHLMWADLGAGKTHTLRYIQRRCDEDARLGIWPLYAVMPKYMKSFVEVYQAIIAVMNIDSLGTLFIDAYPTLPERRKAATELFPAIPDAGTALQKLDGSDVQRSLAAEWLRGSRLTKRDLDSIGVTRVIRTSDDAVAVLSGLVKVAEASPRYARVVVMLDECQRLGNFKLSIGRDINTGLQTWFDACPNHLTLLMSFGSGEERFVKLLINPELQSRVDYQGLRLDLLTLDDAFLFTADLLTVFRALDSPSPYFPFAEEDIRAILKRIVPSSGITPRQLMKAFDSILTEADYRFSTGKAFDVASAEAIDLAVRATTQLGTEADD